MAPTATEDLARPVTVPLARLTGAVLDRLFTPHGPAAYFRWVGAPAREQAPVESPEVHEPPTGAPAPPGPRPDAAAEVTFRSSGLTAVAEGTLLETAEAAGLEPRYRCRRGICGTCTTSKLSGTVLDARTGETSSTAGPIRICVSIPQGDVALDL